MLTFGLLLSVPLVAGVMDYARFAGRTGFAAASPSRQICRALNFGSVSTVTAASVLTGSVRVSAQRRLHHRSFLGMTSSSTSRIVDFTASHSPASSFSSSSASSPPPSSSPSSSSSSSSSPPLPRLRVREIQEAEPADVVGKEILLKGWVRTLRAQKALAFVEVNDGSSRQGLQAVYSVDNIADGVKTASSIFTETIASLSTGASVSIRGIIKVGLGL